MVLKSKTIEKLMVFDNLTLLRRHRRPMTLIQKHWKNKAKIIILKSLQFGVILSVFLVFQVWVPGVPRHRFGVYIRCRKKSCKKNSPNEKREISIEHCFEEALRVSDVDTQTCVALRQRYPHQDERQTPVHSRLLSNEVETTSSVL